MTAHIHQHGHQNRRNKMKKLLPLFGILDIITLIRSYKHLIPASSAWSDYPMTTIASILYASLLFSAYFLIRQQKLGIWLAYIQFPLRMAFLVLSFGFLLSTSSLFNNQSEAYRIMIWALIGLEIIRLVCTIFIHKRYFSVQKTVSRL